jgi:hypothetical protein
MSNTRQHNTVRQAKAVTQPTLLYIARNWRCWIRSRLPVGIEAINF